MKQRGASGGWAGFAMVGLGVGAVAWDSLARQFDWARLGVTLIVCGALVAIYGKLKVRTEPNSETYRLGYDIGYEAGHQEGKKSARPVVVDMDAHRCHHEAAH